MAAAAAPSRGAAAMATGCLAVRPPARQGSCAGVESDVESERLLGAPTSDDEAAGPLGRRLVVAVATLAVVSFAGLVLEAFREQPKLAADMQTEAGLSVIGLQALGVYAAPVPVAASPLSSITANDFWAVHDLLLLGYDAYFMKEGSEGYAAVQKGALELAAMMQELHPYAPCRQQIGAAFTAAGGLGRPGLIAAAGASWACLPAQYDTSSIKTPFVPSLLGAGFKAQKTRMSAPFDLGTLGACSTSAWPRTCSFWVTMHAMARRADAIGASARFLNALLPVLAGGVTMCGGCTVHLHALHKPVLPPAVMRDLGPVH